MPTVTQPAGSVTQPAEQVIQPETPQVMAPRPGENVTLPRYGETVSGQETAVVIKNLQDSIPQLNEMEPAAKVSSGEIQKIEGRTMAEKAKKLFERIIGTVTRKDIGDIEINKRSVKDDLSHGVGLAKAAVIPAIPDVLKKGKQIAFAENWKGRPYDGYVFAAPVELDGKLTYVGAVVKQTSKNKFYLHEVVDSNGNIIKISNGAETNPTSLAAESDAGASTPLPTPIIPQEAMTVNGVMAPRPGEEIILPGGANNGEQTQDIQRNGNGTEAAVAGEDAVYGGDAGGGSSYTDTGRTESVRPPAGVKGATRENRALTFQRQKAATDQPYISPASLGIDGGGEEATMRILAPDDWDDELRGLNSWLGDKGIREVHMVVGTITVDNGGGPVDVLDVIKKDTGELFLRVDSLSRSATETGVHAAGHYMADEEKITRFMNAVKSRKNAVWEPMYEKYMQKWAQVTNYYEGMTEAEKELYVWEEILGDAYANINNMGTRASAFHDIAEAVLEGTGEPQTGSEVSLAEGENAAAAAGIRGPPRYMTAGEYYNENETEGPNVSQEKTGVNNYGRTEETDDGRGRGTVSGIYRGDDGTRRRPGGRSKGDRVRGDTVRSVQGKAFSELTEYERDRLSEYLLTPAENNEAWIRVIRMFNTEDATRRIYESIISNSGLINHMLAEIPGYQGAIDRALDFVNRDDSTTTTERKQGGEGPSGEYASSGRELSKGQAEYFRQSKARDEKGELLTLYHGSKHKAFTQFDIYQGVWMTPDREYAMEYADGRDGSEEIYSDEGQRLYEVYADIKNPVDVGEIGGLLMQSKIVEIADALGVDFGEADFEARRYKGDKTYKFTRSREFIELAAAPGYDGIKAMESGTPTFCAIKSPSQVKLTTNLNPTSNSDVRYSIGETTDNKPFVEVEQDILEGVPKADWVKTVKENLKKKFPNGITVGNNEINIDYQSRQEMTFSKYMQWLYNNDPQLRADKLRATNNADEILQAATDWVNEGLNHPRKDRIVDFARGNVLLRVGGNDYTADVVVGTRKNGNMLLYDVLNLQPTSFTEKETDAAIAENPSPGTNRSTASVSDTSVAEGDTGVKGERDALKGYFDENGRFVLPRAAEEDAADEAPKQTANRYSVDDEQDAAEKKKKKEVKPVAKSRPIIAKKELRQNMMNIFSIPAGSKNMLGDMVDQVADKLLETGTLSWEERKEFFDRMYDSGVMTVAADEYSRDARDVVLKRKIYVPESVKHEFGGSEGYNEFRKTAFAAGVYLTNNKSDEHIDTLNMELAERLPGLFDANDLDMTEILKTVVQVAEEGKGEKMSLADTKEE